MKAKESMVVVGFKAIVNRIGILRFLLYPVIATRRYLYTREDSYFNKFIRNAVSMIVKVPSFMGSFEIDARSNILRRILMKGDYEPEFAKIVVKYLDTQRDALDIGANIGLFSVLIRKTLDDSSKLLSVEPTPRAVELLKANLNRNSCEKNTIIFNGVASNSDGTMEINIIPGMEEYSSIGSIIYKKEMHRAIVNVESNTVDTLVNKYNLNPGFLKVDTEGAELLVFKGAVNTLKKFQPVILSELADTLLETLGSSAKEAIEYLQSLGYKVIDVEFPDKPISYPYIGEILAIPEKRD
jgi:FkbM family methyltransferase